MRPFHVGWIAALVFAAGCKDAGPEWFDVAGAYTLESINNSPLPAQRGPTTIFGGNIVLRADSIWIQSQEDSTASRPRTTWTTGGIWSRVHRDSVRLHMGIFLIRITVLVDGETVKDGSGIYRRNPGVTP